MLSAKKNNSTMRQSKRNIESAYGSLLNVFEDHKVRLRSHGILKNTQQRGSVGSEKNTLLSDIFCQMVPHVWFRLLPLGDQHCDTVAFAVGQECELISTLFQHVKIFKKTKG